MSDFYLTLPSNSSMDIYSDNTMTNFKTMLPNRIELEKQWEVGLVEIQYPHTWYNLREGEEILIQAADRPPWLAEDSTLGRVVIRIPPGYYPTVVHLAQRIEKEISKAMNLVNEKPVSFQYDKIKRKIKARVEIRKSPSSYITLGSTIQRIFGFDSNIIHGGVTEGSLVVDMDPLHSIYVYCDLIEPRVVGDKMVQLLRVVPVEGDHGDVVTRIYKNVHYIPIQLKSFEGVMIDIRDDLGENIPFERGILNVTLHLRPRQLIL